MKQRYYFLFLSVLFAGFGTTQAQTPASAIFQNDKVRAVVQANGVLFNDSQQGQFLPLQAGVAEKTLLRSAGIWMAAKDAEGLLHGAVQVGNQSDCQPGLYDADLGLAQDVNHIWRVNRNDINLHRADFQDNGQIDQPNAAVFAWPGRGNPNTGFNLPDVFQGLAGYYDENENNVYDPAMGDYPGMDIRGCLPSEYNSSMAWLVNNDVGNELPHPSGLLPLKMEIQAQVFNFLVQPAEDLLNNCVLVGYKFIYRGAIPLDSFYLGVYGDFRIGNPNDDFIGSDPGLNLIYGYNSDENDEDGFGSEIPVMAMTVLRGPLNSLGDELDLRSFVALDSADHLQPTEFYNVLRGKRPDGTPAPDNGWMYGGNPNHPGEVSEISTGSIAGPRIGVSTFGPFSLLPGAVNVVFVAYYYVHEPGHTPLQNVQRLYDQTAALRQKFDTGCFSDPDVPTFEPSAKASDLIIFPNPASDEFTVTSNSSLFDQIDVSTILGRSIKRLHLDAPVQKSTLRTTDWPSGLYLVRAGNQSQTLLIMD